MERYEVHRAELPTTGRRLWVIVDSTDLKPMPEARDFAMFLAGAGRSENTIRTYIPKVALFLNWSHQETIDWRNITLPQMVLFKFFLEKPRRVKKRTVQRGAVTVNLTFTAVMEYLRYCARSGWIDRSVLTRLTEAKRHDHLPSWMEAGEDGQYRYQLVKNLRSKESEKYPSFLSEEQVAAAISAATNARDRFLLMLLDTTGMRVGEALGLRRSDMHLLPDSRSLGCDVEGAHIEVVRRSNNANFARAKTRARSIPVTRALVHAYRDCVVERQNLLNADDSDYVFVTFKPDPGGRPLTYDAVMRLFVLLRKRTGIPYLHPHAFRHTYANRLRRSGAKREVLQELLGHANPKSTSIYYHVMDDELRAAADAGHAHLDRYRDDHD